MKNQISHDSIHRVEPSAKFLAEQRTKVEADESAIVKSNEKEREQKETSTTELINSDPADNDQMGQSAREKYKSEPSKKNKDAEPPEKNHFLGGQIFDSKA